MTKDETHYQFPFMVTNGRKDTELLAEATVSPHFVITPRNETSRDSWNVTHVHSRMAAISGIKSKRVARLCAAIMHELLPWDKVTADNASEIAKEYAPDWFTQWRRDVTY